MGDGAAGGGRVGEPPQAVTTSESAAAIDDTHSISLISRHPGTVAEAEPPRAGPFVWRRDPRLVAIPAFAAVSDRYATHTSNVHAAVDRSGIILCMVQVSNGVPSAPRTRRIPDSAVISALMIAGATCSKTPSPTTAMTAAAPPRGAIAELGPAIFDPSQRDDVLAWTWDEYTRRAMELAQIERFVALTRPYPGASNAARYGTFVPSGDKIVGWMLDGDPAGGYRLVVDLNRNGDLADDRVWTLARAERDWRLELTSPPAAGHLPHRWQFAFDGKAVTELTNTRRTGTVSVDGHALPLAVTCPYDDCSDAKWVRIGFDLDGNGDVDLTSPGSYESFKLRNRTVTAFGKTYEFSLAPSGDRLALRATSAAQPRPTLAMGSPAPVFEASDAHATFSLAAARGHVVLLDFFATGCHFCVLDLPWLAKVQERYAAAGLEVVTIAADAAPDVSHDWPVFVESDSTPIADLYRIDALPAYFVVDRDGTLACTRCRHAAADAALARLFTVRTD